MAVRACAMQMQHLDTSGDALKLFQTAHRDRDIDCLVLFSNSHVCLLVCMCMRIFVITMMVVVRILAVVLWILVAEMRSLVIPRDACEQMVDLSMVRFIRPNCTVVICMCL
jgi:hypothetical protein